MDILGREPKDQASPMDKLQYWRGAASDYGSEGICRHHLTRSGPTVLPSDYG